MKVIIDNRSDLTMSHALDLVKKVISMGRISNNGKQYCYLTAVPHYDGNIHIVTDLNKCSDRFVIYRPNN